MRRLVTSYLIRIYTICRYPCWSAPIKGLETPIERVKVQFRPLRFRSEVWNRKLLTWNIVWSPTCCSICTTSGSALAMRFGFSFIYERRHVVYAMIFVSQIGGHVGWIVQNESFIRFTIWINRSRAIKVTKKTVNRYNDSRWKSRIFFFFIDFCDIFLNRNYETYILDERYSGERPLSSILHGFSYFCRFCSDYTWKFLELCLCWGFTAKSTQWGHVERGQFT